MSNTSVQNFKMDHLSVLDKDISFHLNSYRNWGEIDLMTDPFPKNGSPDETDPANVKGTKSLFNNVHAVYYGNGLRMRNNMPLLDGPSIRDAMRDYSDCSIRQLVKLSSENKMGRAIYNYSDFMYCKNLGRISNNYMITLRRFAAPCGDNITYLNPEDELETDTTGKSIQSHAPDVGRLVTWLGTSGNEMSSILKYSYKMPFKDVSSDLHDIDGVGGGDRGLLSTLMNASSEKYREMQIAGFGGDQAAQYMGKIFGQNKLANDFFNGSNSGAQYNQAQWRQFRDNNKVYGPIDVIKKTTVRGDEGLDFTHSFTLTFDYELRSYDGINTKAAFLDLLSNILAVTYTTGAFWGGGYRMTNGMPQSNVYANLPIFRNAETGNIKGWGDLYDAATESISDVWQTISNGDGLKGAIKTLGAMAFSSFLGTALNKLGRPNKIALQSLLEPVPTGLWHVTIGNPRHPILSIGNLILENTEIEHYGPLGLDDFPTGIRVTCTLKHGKPRDNSMIESMYVMGNSRVYLPVGSHVMEMYKKSSQYKASTDTNTTSTGQPTPEANSNTVDYAKIEDGTFKNVLFTYFGTSDNNIIMPSSKEMAFGAQTMKKNDDAKNEPNP